MAWNFVLTDLFGNIHGEVTQATERKVNLPYLRVPAVSFKVPLYHNLADTILETDCMVKCYRTDPVYGTRTLVFIGPVVSAEEVGDETAQSIAVTCAGPYWRLAKRLIPSSISTTGYADGSPDTPTDLGLMAFNILDAIHLDSASYSGIRKGTRTAVGTGAYGPVWLKNVAESIAELSAGLTSFEMRVEPEDITSSSFPFGTTYATTPTIARLDLGPPSALTVNRPDAIFEYGTGRANVIGYSRSIDRSGILNRAHVSVQGWPQNPVDGRALRTVSDATSIAARGLFEEVVSDAGVQDDGLRDKIAGQHVYYRKDPRQLLNFSPARNSKPSPISDYREGDTVRCRAVVRGILRFDAVFRIWGVTFNIDQNGNEAVELELIAP